MILYNYECHQCGRFSAWNSIKNSAKSIACLSCNSPAKRIIAAPYLADMDDNNRIAHFRNEKSAHEPEVVKMINGEHKSCNHSTPRHTEHKRRHIHNHNHPQRPWMIGH